MNRVYLWIYLLPFIVSCNSLIEKYYKQIDSANPSTSTSAQASNQSVVNKKKYDSFAIYRKYKDQEDFDGIPTTQNSKFYSPEIKRRYEKRIKAIDLTDQSNPGSLWYDRGQENFFFSQNDAKRIGDIILIHVYKKLKDKIAQELSRFSTNPHPKGNQMSSLESNEENEDADKGALPENKKNTDEKIYDQISSVVIETINRDHLIIRGIKEVLYKKNKHMIELKGLVKRTNVDDSDIIKSNDFLETSIKVIR